MCPSKTLFLEGIIKNNEKTAENSGEVAFRRANPLKEKIACGLRRLCEASAFIPGVPIVCKIFARKAGLDLWMSFFCRSMGAPIPMLQAHSVARTMSSCKNLALDPQGDHVLTCKKQTEAT